jgi:hypothetical protein
VVDICSGGIDCYCVDIVNGLFSSNKSGNGKSGEGDKERVKKTVRWLDRKTVRP